MRVHATDEARCDAVYVPSVFGKAVCQSDGHVEASSARPDSLDQTDAGKRSSLAVERAYLHALKGNIIQPY